MIPLLHRLFAHCPWTSLELLNHVWQSTVVGGAILLLISACRKLSAETRRSLGWIGLLKFVLPIAGIASRLHRLSAADPQPLAAAWSPMTLPLSPALFSAASEAAPGSAASHLPLWGAAVWLAGFGGLAGYWLIRGAGARRLIARGIGPASDAASERIAQAATRMGLRRPPPCRATSGNFGPGVMGFFSPVILVPAGLENILAREEYEAVAMHEIVHWQRRDNLWSALQALTLSALWFNPVVWLLCRSLRLETEKSCDERVVGLIDDPETYAVGIVKTVRQALGLMPAGLSGMATAPVIERLENILAPRASADRKLIRLVAIGAGVSLVAFGSYAGGFAPRTPVLIEPQAETLDTPAPTAEMVPPTEPQMATPLPALDPPPVTPSPAAPASAATGALLASSPVQEARLVAPPTIDEPPVPPSPASLAVRPSIQPPAFPLVIRPADEPRIYQQEELDRPPAATHEGRPWYPSGIIAQDSINARVTVAFVISSAGRVMGARIRSCTIETAYDSIDFDAQGRGFDSRTHHPVSSNKNLAKLSDAAAQYGQTSLDAVKNWTFRPGQKAGEPVYSVLAVEIAYAYTPPLSFRDDLRGLHQVFVPTL